MKRVQLNSGRIASLDRRHPWIFSRALVSVKGIEIGDIVDVVGEGDRFLARGYYEEGSIAVRLLTFDEEESIDADFWVRRLRESLDMRRVLGLLESPNEAYRLVHGEGDRLPGLIIDIYGNVAVIQAHTLTMHIRQKEIVEALKALYGQHLSAIYYKSSDTLPIEEPVLDQLLWGERHDIETIVAEENGLRFAPDILKGQKTGFFLDQRLSRQRVGELAKDKKVLNMFSYTGGFSLYALRGGARQVVSLDSSAKAIDMLESNMRLNFSEPELEKHSSVVEDAFKYLYDMKEGAFDLIVLDPPAFAKRREVLKNGLQGYRKLNTEAMRKIASGGLLFTFSCSQVVSVEDFRQALFTSALHAGREIRVLQQFGQFADHPVSIYHPEGEYLKGFLLYVV
ncbi:class I SAM-dependent rRNA methyltransferase [Porphyromonas levii]|uniref:class I SAM-dependent rRNA methyltransferase n=1 Tax=Porphyromonas levii TaxID=28114 RepID=UPI00035EEE24|nr:class I SAM-dependent rRNA methyltransferase [Porphyromonas levii]MBR8729026.1 Ribosomal RNA large subunit methyltransferase I [Porphyromonas levii]MBR8731766.1 Ribosomal RNA large subunit methyltransferase I [Porphyromonas levii]MBR8759702.1 Ribosomal RNA large subunit methyltransferase I [Porphyromonas levii]MBR8763069.1 Ribosomal RNA large subunit methyltransferase I [Porphyromonas levii]MBR8801668.1 Ribosomal RNA large subunit methyltransferase I [Porphyromonas levii]